MVYNYTLDDLLAENIPHPGEPEYWETLEPPRLTELIPLSPEEDDFSRRLAEGLRALADRHHVSLEFVAGVAYGMLKGEREDTDARN